MLSLKSLQTTVTAEIDIERTIFFVFASFRVAAIQRAPDRSERCERAPAKRRSFFADRTSSRPGRALQRTPALTARAPALCRIFPSGRKNWNNFRSFSTLRQFSRFKIKLKKTVSKTNSLISTSLEKTKKSFHVYYVSVSPF